MSFLYPGEYMESTYVIDFKQLYKQGYRGVIFDVDNTLVPHGAPADERAKYLMKELYETGYRCMLLSNNKEPRVKMFSDAIHEYLGTEVFLDYIYKAGKPKKSGYQKAMGRMGTSREETLFVGDQIFTDIAGANRVGIRTILVKPIHPKEEIQIVLKRRLEKVVLMCYQIHCKFFRKR